MRGLKSFLKLDPELSFAIALPLPCLSEQSRRLTIMVIMRITNTASPLSSAKSRWRRGPRPPYQERRKKRPHDIPQSSDDDDDEWPADNVHAHRGVDEIDGAHETREPARATRLRRPSIDQRNLDAQRPAIVLSWATALIFAPALVYLRAYHMSRITHMPMPRISNL